MTGGEVRHSGNQGDALPASVQVAAVLLIVQALIRVGFLLLTLFTLSSAHASSARYRSPFFVIQAIGVPAAFSVAGLVAGILAFQRSSAARPFGLALCAVGLPTSFSALAASFTSFLRDLRFTFLGFPGSSLRRSSPSILRGSSSSYCGAKSRPIGEHWSGPR